MSCDTNPSQSFIARSRESELRKKEPLSTPPADAAERFGADTETILVVDDEVLVRNITRRFLEGFGYQVLTAGSGAEAESVIDAYPGSIHLLLTDIVMAGMDGKELSIRIAGKRPELKTLFMSAYPREVLRGECILEEGAGFLGKPFTRTALSEKVREVLDSRRRMEA
ncbi:MAG: response regulator [Chlorobiaceae bacterium]